MNAKVYYWLGVGSAFAAGVISGVAGVRINLERKLRAEYAAREEMMQRAYEQALEMGLAEKEAPQTVLDEIELLEISLDQTPTSFGEGILTVGGDIVLDPTKNDPDAKETWVEPKTENPYHKAVEATATSHEMFVDGGINDYGVSYIEEEDYLDEDGRFKGKIDIIMGFDQEPIFLMDGNPIDDWDKRIGDSILVDFFKLVPPGFEPILYVRNHRTDEDYEVVRVEP